MVEESVVCERATPYSQRLPLVSFFDAKFHVIHRSPILRIPDCNSLALPRTLRFRPLKVLGGRTGAGSYYLVNLLEEEILFSFPSKQCPLLYISSYCFYGKSNQVLSFQAWPGLQRYTQPMAKALRSKGLVRQTGRTQLNQKVAYGNIILKMSPLIAVY